MGAPPFGVVNNMKIVDFPKVAMCFSRKKEKSIFSIEDIVAKINWKEMHKDWRKNASRGKKYAKEIKQKNNKKMMGLNQQIAKKKIEFRGKNGGNTISEMGEKK